MTPVEIDDDVKKLISTVCPDSKPIYLPVEPESYAQVNECFPAVAEKIKRDGGSRVIGWQIWKTNIIVEAEFHALWESPQGELKDITPKPIPISNILFLPDHKANYIGAQVDNIRINISKNELVDDIIEIAKAIFRIGNKGKRAFQYELKLSGKEATIYNTLHQMKAAIYLMVQNGMTKDHPCFCGSLMNYRFCHGNNLVDSLKSL